MLTAAATGRNYIDTRVPMGGDLYSAPSGQVPTFLVAASKDNSSRNLDWIRIIEGWRDKQGSFPDYDEQTPTAKIVWG
ncbi:MAG: DUF3604 domain-containing protein [Pirellula sp.]